MLKVGLIDVDGHNYPNIPLMKLSAWHKQKGDLVEWYSPMFSGHMNIVYMSKVFTFTPDYEYYIDSEKIIRGGTGYAISLENGKEFYDKSKDMPLDFEIEHIYPDYEIYPDLTKDKAFGFLTRGCPRNCQFCHVSNKEGQHAYKVSNLSEFWRGQKHIVLFDPNILACPDYKDLLQQLIDSKAHVNFNQGLDIRLMTEEKAKMFSEIKLDAVHFAWDRYEDKKIIIPKFEMFRKISNVRQKDLQVYVLCGDKEARILPGDLDRIYWLRENGFAPYVMLYNKNQLPKGHELRKLQRWVNMRAIFWSVPTFEEYQNKFN